jgi:hypothetical protein
MFSGLMLMTYTHRVSRAKGKKTTEDERRTMAVMAVRRFLCEGRGISGMGVTSA